MEGAKKREQGKETKKISTSKENCKSLSAEAVQPETLGLWEGLVAERYSRERGKIMNWNRLERLIGSCVENESAKGRSSSGL